MKFDSTKITPLPTKDYSEEILDFIESLRNEIAKVLLEDYNKIKKNNI